VRILWKPLDLMGKRLYRVAASFRGQRSHHIIAADAPRHAAALYLESIGPAREDTDATGFALQVGQPANWFDDRRVSSLDCSHRCETICCMDGAGPGFNRSYHVSICMDCGEITVYTTKDGKRCEVKFGLNCDRHLRAAAKYMRTVEEQQEAMIRCNAAEMNGRAETNKELESS